MELQNYEKKTEKIRNDFLDKKRTDPGFGEEKLKFSWSNWGFGTEAFQVSCARLERAGISYIELHGNHYGKDLGYRPKEILPVMDTYGLKASGVCGMFSPECDLSARSGRIRQEALDYVKRELEFTARVGGEYLLIVPAAVGRPQAYDGWEWERSVETLRQAAGLFEEYGIKGAVEPIRSAETSLVHTVAEAKKYMEAVGCDSVGYINGDVYHMQSEEAHIGEAILEAGDRLVNLHLADTNRSILGSGSMDIDCIIMALYLIGYQKKKAFVTPEPLGPGGDPYPAMYAKADAALCDQMVMESCRYFRERERLLIEG